MEETISIGQIIDILKKRIKWIISGFIVGILLAGTISFFFLTPRYSSASQLIVQVTKQSEGNVNLQNDINGNLLLINTYKDMIMGDLVIEKVREELKKDHGYHFTNEELKNMIEVQQSQNSQMFQIITKAARPREAAHVSNKVSEVFQSKAQEVLDINKVTITSNALAPHKPFWPNHKLNLLIGTAIGLISGLALAFGLELFDKTVNDEAFIADKLELPVLGQVSEMTRREVTEGKKTLQTKSERKKSSATVRTLRERM
ncbi:tyrosine protein kinase [Enterococcus florum]|uniref:Capsular polysaccharide biosynthesis protein CpsC n=1 Tax=Enterococcus florum TaxID=2480627 RepID=A0A4P5PBG7_9ENTE|nr:Wzz/FepE/Etk N-terminal domain-containing protein [Enterococcus florum]GCF93288.1 tyrosine protein kinase [Enterococcus florum]